MTLVAFWFIVLAVLWTGFFLLEGFDFGVGMLHGVVGRDEGGRQVAVRAISPVWDGNEVWLIVAVAVTFAAFPAWYATMLSGFYPIFLVVLVALILRGVSFEFRSHAAGERSRRFWDGALTGGSLVIPLGLGIVLGNLLGGVPIDPAHEFVGNVGDLFRPYAVASGVTIALVCLLHGAVFLALRTAGDVRLRALRLGATLGPVTAVVVLVFVAWTRIDSGRGVLLSVVELGAVLAAVAAAVLIRGGREGAAFAATSATMAAVVVSLFAELYPRVMVSSIGAANDLTVSGTAASPYALRVMTVVLVVLLPVILAYQGWTYHVFRSRLSRDDVPGAAPSPQPQAVGESAADTAVGHRGDPSRIQVEAVTWPSRPVARLVWWALAWGAAWLFARLMAAVAPADSGAGRSRTQPSGRR
ncbi:cytochrome d ubiquinol oxidase subunit II [Pseudonocardia aurantiaca]|uniref:Cytochrome d ubiquinol oxidase subunit II n=1 Tax=Pseudonocardia aurantiaca TaxID=75290 RepID=A0ABW4FN10_9PSEU